MTDILAYQKYSDTESCLRSNNFIMQLKDFKAKGISRYLFPHCRFQVHTTPPVTGYPSELSVM